MKEEDWFYKVNKCVISWHTRHTFVADTHILVFIIR